MTFLSILVTITGTLMGLAALPQAIKIFKNKSAKDVSIITYLVFLVGAIIWILYGLELKDSPIIIANLTVVFCSILVIIGWGRYRK